LSNTGRLPKQLMAALRLSASAARRISIRHSGFAAGGFIYETPISKMK
jgi:hypothetical protein